MSEKLNAMRLLETHQIPYEVLLYTDSDGKHGAVEVARVLGVPPEHLYKTLVVENAAGGKPMLIMIAAGKSLNLKKAAAAIGVKKISMAAHEDAEKMTGLKTGGIGALALVHKNWAVYVDQPAQALEYICVSAGQRGVNLKVPTQGLIKVVKARLIEATDTEASGMDEGSD